MKNTTDKIRKRHLELQAKIAELSEQSLPIACANEVLLTGSQTSLDQISGETLPASDSFSLRDIPESTAVLWSETLLQIHGRDPRGISWDDLLSSEELQQLEEDFSSPLLKRLEAKCAEVYGCDKVDYTVAALAGTLAGLIDVVFVGLPGNSIMGDLTASAADQVVMKFARLCGWKGACGNSSEIASAIGYLERKFKVNYDQRLSDDVGGQFSLRPGTHHLLSLSHSPSPLGLICSIINQFTSTSTFIAEGKLITIDTETFDLHGGNFIAKVFAGFWNWLGHIMSDIAGSSGTRGHEGHRGTGVCIPFFELFQFLDIGAWSKDRKTIAELSVQMFEHGYDFRHGAACAVPVILNELFIRSFWMCKRHYRHGVSWKEALPRTSNPGLNRALLVGHGCLCLVDVADAGLRCGGVPLTFLLRCNLIAWGRLGVAGLRELKHLGNKRRFLIQSWEERHLTEYRKRLEALC